MVPRYVRRCGGWPEAGGAGDGSKSFPFFLESSARRAWPIERPGAEELAGTRALILGYGSIGRAVAERLRGFGVDVTGVWRNVQGEAEVLSPTEWRDHLAVFDWILLTAALTADTRHMLGAEEFRRMKRTSWIVNIARGGLIDQTALVAALHAGPPRGAYLDVTDPEPRPPDHPLWSAPDVTITGHSAGRGTRSLQRYAALFLENLERFRTGQTLVNVVDFRQATESHRGGTS